MRKEKGRRLGSLKVEGSWKLKLAVYGGALGMILGILGVMYLLLGGVGSGPPEVGTVTLKSEGLETAPLQNEIFVTENGVTKEKRRLVPGEIGDRAPTAEYSHSFSLLFQGKSDNGPFYFTIYNEAEKIYSEKKAEFLCPEEPGKYLVCEETYWGTKKDHIGMEYYFWLVIGPEDLED